MMTRKPRLQTRPHRNSSFNTPNGLTNQGCGYCGSERHRKSNGGRLPTNKEERTIKLVLSEDSVDWRNKDEVDDMIRDAGESRSVEKVSLKGLKEADVTLAKKLSICQALDVIHKFKEYYQGLPQGGKWKTDVEEYPDWGELNEPEILLTSDDNFVKIDTKRMDELFRLHKPLQKNPKDYQITDNFLFSPEPIPLRGIKNIRKAFPLNDRDHRMDKLMFSNTQDSENNHLQESEYPNSDGGSGGFYSIMTLAFQLKERSKASSQDAKIRSAFSSSNNRVNTAVYDDLCNLGLHAHYLKTNENENIDGSHFAVLRLPVEKNGRGTDGDCCILYPGLNNVMEELHEQVRRLKRNEPEQGAYDYDYGNYISFP